MSLDTSTAFDLQAVFDRAFEPLNPASTADRRRWMIAMPVDLPRFVRGHPDALSAALDALLRDALADATLRSPVIVITRVPASSTRLQLRLSLEQTGTSRVWSAEPAADHADLHEAPTTGLRDLRVLVIDRLPRMRQLIAETCRAAGMQPVQARDGLTALSSIDLAHKTEHPFDLIVLDEMIAERTCLGSRLADSVAPSRLVLIGSAASPAPASDDDPRVQRIRTPFTPSTLLAACARAWQAPAAGASAMPAAPSRTASTMQVLSSISGLDTAVGMVGVEGKLDLYRRLLCLFRDGQRALRERADIARRDGRDDDLRRLMHTLKGNARGLGMPAIGEAAARVEHALKNGTPVAELDIPIEIALIETELMVGHLDVLGDDPAPTTAAIRR